jgi:hypothetical protein
MLLIVGALRNRAAGQNLGSQSHDEQVKKQRAARLEIMRRHASSLAVKVENDGAFVEARIVDIPLLHYNNPAGETLDATVWAWGVRGRPVALASISQEMSLAALEKWSCELVSLADKPVLLESNPGWRWASKTSGIEWKLAPDAPAVGETPVVRARQMTEIARRLSATGVYKDGKEVIELRLLDRPLRRFADREHGLIDGAFYAFAGGTNPEVLVMIECRQDGSGNSAWHYGFARMGAGRLTARLGETVIWERPEIKLWNPAERYFSVYGAVDSVFGRESAVPGK